MLKKLSNKQIIIFTAVLLVAVISVAAIILLTDKSEPEQERFIYEDFEYVILEDGRLEITSYIGSELEVTVPDAIKGRSVYSIGSYAFAQSSVVKVVLGSFTKHINDYAFYDSQNLEQVLMEDEILSMTTRTVAPASLTEKYMCPVL